jgi:hypothetical protein
LTEGGDLPARISVKLSELIAHMTLILSAPEDMLREGLRRRKGDRADDAETVIDNRFKVSFH